MFAPLVLLMKLMLLRPAQMLIGSHLLLAPRVLLGKLFLLGHPQVLMRKHVLLALWVLLRKLLLLGPAQKLVGPHVLLGPQMLLVPGSFRNVVFWRFVLNQMMERKKNVIGLSQTTKTFLGGHSKTHICHCKP